MAILSDRILTNDEELYWLALRLVPGLGTRAAAQVLERFRTPQAIFRASAANWNRRLERRAGAVGGERLQFEEAARQQQKMTAAGAWLSPSATRAIRQPCARSSILRPCCSRAAGSSCWRRSLSA